MGFLPIPQLSNLVKNVFEFLNAWVWWRAFVPSHSPGYGVTVPLAALPQAEIVYTSLKCSWSGCFTHVPSGVIIFNSTRKRQERMDFLCFDQLELSLDLLTHSVYSWTLI